MPALYALAQHEALVAAAGKLQPNEWLFAFLDDLYVVTTKERAEAAFRTVAEEVETKAGVKTHLGKLKAWGSKGGEAPAGLHALSPEAWTGNLDEEKNGLVVLGVPVGRDAFVREHGRQRLEKGRATFRAAAEHEGPTVCLGAASPLCGSKS